MEQNPGSGSVSAVNQLSLFKANNTGSSTADQGLAEPAVYYIVYSGRSAVSRTENSSLQGRIDQALANDSGLRCRTELAQALATMQLVRASLRRPHGIVDAAISRISDQLELERFLAQKDHGDLRLAFVNMLRVVVGSRAENARLRIRYSGLEAVGDPASTKLAILIGYHLLTDALARHRQRDQPITIRLVSNGVRFSVSAQSITDPLDMTLLPTDDVYETIKDLAFTRSGRIVILKKGTDHTVRVSMRLPRQRSIEGHSG